MKGYRLPIFVLFALALGGVFWFPRPEMRTARAAEARPTAGQLSILDRDGKPTGLCPLQRTDVIADIDHYVARVTVTQRFHNLSSDPVEAVYTFPLPEDAAVDDMTMTIGERVIRGDIKRREEAREIYEAAKSEGKAAALLDQERPNIFTQSVANLMPGDDVVITISYVNLLKYDEGRYEFTFPMVVGPRYTPTGGYTVPGKRGDPNDFPSGGSLKGGVPAPDGRGRVVPLTAEPKGDVPIERGRRTGSRPLSGRPVPNPDFYPAPGTNAVVTDADKITPPITPPGTRAGHDITLRVNLNSGVPLADVKSVLHPVVVQNQGAGKATIRLKSEATIPNRDFILRYTVAGSEVRSAHLVHANGDGTGYFTLILQPPVNPPASRVTPKEMIFVLDQTGSQSGWPIEKSKETMRRCIRSMNPGDTFQLIGFNTDVYPCFPKSVPNTPENVKKALAFLEPLQGSGGTDILKSVETALRMPDDPNRLRIVCYMTDGFVGNDMQILDFIGKNRGRARMFPFGIGNSVNRFLIDGMAREGRGAAEVVTLEASGQEASEKFQRRIDSPLLLDPTVDWGGLPVVDVYPEHLPDVFTAGPVIVKGRYTRPADGIIELRGRLRGQPWRQRIHVTFPGGKGGDPDRVSSIGNLWAREKIEHLQSQDWIGAQTGKPQSDLREKIIETALRHRLMSQYTSFVAVEERVVNVDGKPRKVDVPVEMADGVSYEGIFGKEEAETGAPARNRGAFLYGANSPAPATPLALGRVAGGAAATPALRPAENRVFVRRKTDAATAGDRLEVQLEELGDLDETGARKPMTPEEQKKAQAESRLAPSLRGLAERVRKDGKNGSLRVSGLPEVKDGKVVVQIRLAALPSDGMTKLKALGFTLTAVLTPNRLLLGAIPVEKLIDLTGLDFIRRIEPPRYRT